MPSPTASRYSYERAFALARAYSMQHKVFSLDDFWGAYPEVSDGDMYRAFTELEARGKVELDWNSMDHAEMMVLSNYPLSK